jgi:hypothetical protein
MFSPPVLADAAPYALRGHALAPGTVKLTLPVPVNRRERLLLAATVAVFAIGCPAAGLLTRAVPLTSAADVLAMVVGLIGVGFAVRPLIVRPSPLHVVIDANRGTCLFATGSFGPAQPLPEPDGWNVWSRPLRLRTREITARNGPDGSEWRGHALVLESTVPAFILACGSLSSPDVIDDATGNACGLLAVASPGKPVRATWTPRSGG